MSRAHVKNVCEVVRTGRVAQIEAMFDVPKASSSVTEFTAELPIEEKSWNVGLIVGPSGSGKSSLARELFPKEILADFAWPANKSVLDAFPSELSIKDIAYLLGNVGFNSPPSWLRPHRVLSTGEKFRVEIARALATTDKRLVVDEFTSVVDRKVAKVASHCVQKAVRKLKKQFVAVTCHFDVIEWLQPDWVFQMQDRTFEWRSLRRHPAINLRIHPVSRALWPAFAQYHYLSHELASSAKCFGAFYDGECIAFNSILKFPHAKVRNMYMAHRLVVHPDYQGLGIGGRIADWMGQYLAERNLRYRFCIASPTMISMFARSPRWALVRGRVSGSNLKSGPRADAGRAKAQMKLRRMSTMSFEYVKEK